MLSFVFTVLLQFVFPTLHLHSHLNLDYVIYCDYVMYSDGLCLLHCSESITSWLPRLGEGGDVALVRHDGRGSEGFLEHIFKHAAKELFGLEVHEITYKTLR